MMPPGGFPVALPSSSDGGGQQGDAAARPQPGNMQLMQPMQPMQAQMAQMQMAAMMQMQMQMQMGAMAQMQMMQMMQMQQMQQAGAQAMPAAPAAPTAADIEKAEEDAKLAGCTLEDMKALEAEVKELEQEEKDAAKEKKAYVGLMARYIEDDGFGFISCPECKDVWDKTDIFVSGRTFMASSIDVGDMVIFTVEKDGKDLPRAVSPKTLEELTKLRKRLTRMREVLRSITAAAAACGTSTGGVLPRAPPTMALPLNTMHSAGTMAPSLKRPSDALLEAHMLQGPGAAGAAPLRVGPGVGPCSAGMMPPPGGPSVKRPNLGMGPGAYGYQT